MRQCLLMRATHERVKFSVDGVTLRAEVQNAFNYAQSEEIHQTPEVALERYEEMKMIAVVDYGFQPFIENIDGE